MNNLDFSTEQKEWLARNPELAQTILANAVDRALAYEKAREKRRRELLQPEWSINFPGRPSFDFEQGFKGSAMIPGGTPFARFEGPFDGWFSGKKEVDVPAADLIAYRILPGSRETPYATGAEICNRIGENNPGLFLAQIRYFLEGAKTAPWYCFYAKDARGVLRSIQAACYEDGWHVYACHVGYNDELRNGGYVVSLAIE